MAQLRLLLLCVIGIGFANAGQLDRVNNVILADIQTDIGNQGISKLEFLEQLVVGFERRNKLDGGSKAGGADVQACTELFNETLCSNTLAQNCYDVKELLTSAVDTDDFNISDVFPVLVYHTVQSHCESPEPEPEAENEGKHGKKLSSAKAWGYGIGFSLLICFISNIGGLMGPFMEKAFFQRLLLFFVALAVGTLASTGFLVLVPESMHLTTDDSPVPGYKNKMSTVMIGVYIFYVSELLMKMWFNRSKTTDDVEKEVDNEKAVTPLNGSRPDKISEHQSQHGHSHFPKALDVAKELGKQTRPVSTIAWMILIGDALHNFVDGISIGAAFTENVTLGVSVSLAILCEELPHELGDIAILLHTGMSMKRALLYNFLAAVVVLVGLVIGIVVGENTNANSWIFAIAGGMFIYISLVDMLPEMRQQATNAIESRVETPWTVFVIQNLGLLTGFCIIALLVFFY